jgi:hypothetical protein
MSEPITATELHAHIQRAIFGFYKRGRFKLLQAKLHELVDRPSDVEICKAFAERVEARAQASDWEGGYAAAIADEIYLMEEAVLHAGTQD